GLASALGAGVYAFSGFVCLSLQHLGLVLAYAWFPMGFLAVDQAIAQKHWRPLLKLVAASALIFLAGYPPIWFVFSVSIRVYAFAISIRAAAGAVVALAASLLVAYVQLLPAWEMSRWMLPESLYGGGIKDPNYYISYLVPNYYNFGLKVPIF